MDKKSGRGWRIATLFGVTALSASLFFSHTAQAQEDAAGEDPYLVDNFERYMGDEERFSEVWVTGGEENSQYTVALSTLQSYDGGNAM